MNGSRQHPSLVANVIEKGDQQPFSFPEGNVCTPPPMKWSSAENIEPESDQASRI